MYQHSCGQKIAYGFYYGKAVFFLEDPLEYIDNCPKCGKILPDFLPSSSQEEKEIKHQEDKKA
jgi:hypothetical protein